MCFIVDLYGITSIFYLRSSIIRPFEGEDAFYREEVEQVKISKIFIVQIYDLFVKYGH